MVITVAALALFATGVGPRPAGAVWGIGYDLVLYNVIYLGAACVCFLAARPRSAYRMPWIAMGVSMLLGVTGNLVYTLLISPMAEEPYPSVADFFYLAYFIPLYVALIGLIRARVPRFHASMWLDGIIGALGASAVAVAGLVTARVAGRLAHRGTPGFRA